MNKWKYTGLVERPIRETPPSYEIYVVLGNDWIGPDKEGPAIRRKGEPTDIRSGIGLVCRHGNFDNLLIYEGSGVDKVDVGGVLQDTGGKEKKEKKE